MELADQWPLVLVALAVFIVLAGLLRRLAKLAFFGMAIGVLGLVVWPFVSGAI